MDISSYSNTVNMCIYMFSMLCTKFENRSYRIVSYLHNLYVSGKSKHSIFQICKRVIWELAEVFQWLIITAGNKIQVPGKTWKRCFWVEFHSSSCYTCWIGIFKLIMSQKCTTLLCTRLWSQRSLWSTDIWLNLL